jgi:hypothetical protein
MSTTASAPKAKSSYQCPRCGRELERTSRNTIDKIINTVIPIRRYKCYGCFWEGIRLYRGTNYNGSRKKSIKDEDADQ